MQLMVEDLDRQADGFAGLKVTMYQLGLPRLYPVYIWPTRGTEQVCNLTFAITKHYIASTCSASIDLTTRLIAESVKYRNSYISSIKPHA